MKELIQTEELRKQLDSVNPLKENFTTKEWILSRRDEMKVARLRKAARLSSPKSYVATVEDGYANPWLSGAP